MKYEHISINISVDEIGERYRLKHAIVVKLYHLYATFISYLLVNKYVCVCVCVCVCVSS